MKKLKNTLKLLPVLLFLFIASCKKDNAGPEPGTDNDDPNIDQGIAREELLDYYMVSEEKSGDQKLGVIYFIQEDNVVKMVFHRRDYLRVKEISVANSTFSFDANGDGNSVYTFSFEKDTDGQLKLKSYQYVNKGDPNQGLAYAALARKTEAPAFANASFKAGDLLFNFATAGTAATVEWDIRRTQIGSTHLPPPLDQVIPIYGNVPEVSKSYYILENIGWKADPEFIGVYVPNWKDVSTPVMLVQRNATIYQGIKQ